MKINRTFFFLVYSMVAFQAISYATPESDELECLLKQCKLQELHKKLDRKNLEHNIGSCVDVALQNQECAVKIMELFAKTLGNSTKVAQAFHQQRPTPFLQECAQNPQVLRWFMETTKGS